MRESDSIVTNVTLKQHDEHTSLNTIGVKYYCDLNCAKYEVVCYSCTRCDFICINCHILICHVQTNHEGILYDCPQCDY